MTDPLSLIPKEAFVASRTGKFEAKLTFEQRCTVLALVVGRVSRPVIARAFGVDRRTVTHICNEASAHYRNVRAKLKELGPDEFKKQYISEADALAIAAAMTDVQAQSEPTTVPSSRRTSAAGMHTVKPDQCAYSHRLEIQFFKGRDDTTDFEGWLYRDLDSKEPDMWFNNGPESMTSSTACLEAAKANLTD